MNVFKKTLLLTFLFLLITVPVSASTIELSTNTESIAPDETFTVSVSLSGNEPTFGTDLILIYDPQTLEVVSITPGNLYPSYQPTSLEKMIENPGTILLSGSTDINNPVPATGEMVQVEFKALQTGTTYVGLDYKRDSTTTSGIVGADGSELLTSGPPSLQIKIAKPFSYLPLFIGVGVIGLISAFIMFRMKKKHAQDSRPEVIKEPEGF